MTSERASARLVWGVVVSVLTVTGCPRRSRNDTQASASAVTKPLPAPVASGFPAPDVVSAVVNPKAEVAYAGPRGVVRGRVLATGDPPREQPSVLSVIPQQCGKGREAYGKLFREGPGRTLADVLVAVTGYKGYVPETEPTLTATADGCFWGTRTFALTFGQRLDIVSGDSEAYVPELLGEHGQPQLVATPGGKTASHLYPTRPGRYQVVDNLKLFMLAEVIVLKYSTHAVTGLDGRFEIRGVPSGQVTVSALLPQTGATVTRSIALEPDKPTEEITFEIPFDAAEYANRTRAADAGAPPVGSASSSPAASGKAASRDAGIPRAASSLRPP